MSRKSGSRPSKRKTTPPADVSSRAPSLDPCPPRGRVTLPCAPRHELRLRLDVRLAVNELTHDGIGRALNLVHGSNLSRAALVEHRDTRSDRVGAPHVVCDDDARHTELVAHADHELID